MKKNIFLLIGLLIICFNFKAQIGGFENPVRLSTTIKTDAEETMTLFFKGNKKEIVVLDTDMNNKDAKTEIIEVSTTTSEKTATKNTEEEKGATKFRTDITVTVEQQANIDNGFYILQEGETLYRASINSKVSIAELRRINNLKSNNVYPGTKLLLK